MDVRPCSTIKFCPRWVNELRIYLVRNGVLVLNGFINGRGTSNPVSLVLDGLMNLGINLMYNGDWF